MVKQKLGNIKGADGFSPTASVTQESGATTISITDKNGTTTKIIELFKLVATMPDISEASDSVIYIHTANDRNTMYVKVGNEFKPIGGYPIEYETTDIDFE